MYKYIVCFLILNHVFALSPANATDRTQSNTVFQGNYLTIVKITFVQETDDENMFVHGIIEKAAVNQFAGSPSDRLFAQKGLFKENNLWINHFSWKLLADRLMAYHINFHGLLSAAFMVILLSMLFPYNKPNSPVRPNQ